MLGSETVSSLMAGDFCAAKTSGETTSVRVHAGEFAVFFFCNDFPQNRLVFSLCFVCLFVVTMLWRPWFQVCRLSVQENVNIFVVLPGFVQVMFQT